MLYSLRVSFEESKPVLWISVIGYFVLQTALWAWKRWVEGGEVFRGKRRRVIKRVSFAAHCDETQADAVDRDRPSSRHHLYLARRTDPSSNNLLAP